jgi:hypothetical protein
VQVLPRQSGSALLPPAAADQSGVLTIRIRISDPTRLGDLRDFFRRVSALAVEHNATTLDVSLVGALSRSEEQRHLRAYLDTWLRLRGYGISAEIDPVDAESS